MADNPKASSIVDKHVGSRIRTRRLLVGLSQEKLADALGLTFQQVQKYEKGTNRVGVGRLLQIADILGVTIDYFVEGAPDLAVEQGRAGNAETMSQLQKLFETKDGI